jgi:uncharacterized protein YjiS (DUF1127 family)
MATTGVLSREALSIGARGPSPTRRLIATLREWHRRASSRRELAGLSYAEIKDIAAGTEIEAEKHKPFWQA